MDSDTEEVIGTLVVKLIELDGRLQGVINDMGRFSDRLKTVEAELRRRLDVHHS